MSNRLALYFCIAGNPILCCPFTHLNPLKVKRATIWLIVWYLLFPCHIIQGARLNAQILAHLFACQHILVSISQLLCYLNNKVFYFFVHIMMQSL